MSGPPDMALFFGRLHPVLVHLPIGLIVLLATLELLARSRRFKNANAGVGFVLALAVPVAVVTVVCGWLLSLGGGYQPQLLQWHKWTGIGAAVACILAAGFYWLDLKKLYRTCLFTSVAVLLVAGHFGGSLTHGSDYLVRYAPAPLRKFFGGHPESAVAIKPKDINQAPAFAGLVEPVLQQDCVSCHGPEKSQADLRLDSLSGLLKGGKSGAAILAGDASGSLILKRIRLTADDKHHMPPQGKPQASRDDIALLQWWIRAGAPGETKVGDLHPPASIASILQARFGAPAAVANAVPPKPLKEVAPLAAELSDDLHIALTFQAEDQPWLQCNASIAGKSFGDAELARLATLAPNLRWLDLAGTKITDDGLKQVAAMPNLESLHLERTAVTDAGMARLGAMSNLGYLNLYSTAITDAGLAHLQGLPKLRKLYLWQTQVTPAAAKAFAETHTDPDQVQSWRDQIAELETKIQDEHMSVEFGIPVATAPMTNSTAINTECPISGKPVNLAKTVVYEGSVVALCCDDCKAKFEKDPTPWLAKLGLNPKMPKPKTEKTP